MGKILEQWLDTNAERLAGMSGAPPPPIAGMQGRPPAFGPQGSIVPGARGFPEGSGSQPGFSGGVAPNTPAFQAQAPVAAPVAIGQPAPKPPTEAPKPRNGNGFADMYKEADPQQIDKAIEVMEKAGGAPVEELYTRQTGSPPPQGSNKREIGEFLFEFGLNLLAAPAGEASATAIGGAAQQTIQARRGRKGAAEQRRIEADERRLGRMDKAFDRAATMERLDLQRKQVEASLNKPTGTFDNYVGDDGYMYTYNEQTGEGRRVMVNGRPVKPDPRQNRSQQQRFDTEVRYNLYMGVHGKDPEGAPLEGGALRSAREGALKFANREREYTQDEARRDAVKQATTVLSQLPDYTLATPKEQRTILEEKVSEYTNLLMYGSGPGEGIPDASKLAEGMATPVTNDQGVTEYWTLRDGRPVKVSEDQLQQ